MKYTKAGGTVGFRIIQKGHAPEGFADYDFVVKDNGIGMSEEFAEHIFEPFTREETSTVSRIPGTGLGMAITKNIVDMMGGTIKVKSELGVGSEFTISLRFKTTQQNSKRSWSYSILCETVVCIRIIRCTAERKPSCEDKR